LYAVFAAALALVLSIAPKPANAKVLGALLYTALFASYATLMLLSPLDLDTMSLSGGSFLVTGCTAGGIGFEIAKALLAFEADHVVCTVRSAVKARELELLLPKVKAEVLELSDFSSVRELCKRAPLLFPKGLDGLVLNAGLATDSLELTKDGFEELYVSMCTPVYVYICVA
jgi:hypothetical protein